MDLCYALLEKKIRTVCLHPEWAFSSGVVKEYFFSSERKIRLLDTDGQPFTLARARAALESVLQKLNELHLSTARIEKRLQQLNELNCTQ